MKLATGLQQALGKQLTGFIAAENDGRPPFQLFLVFDDGTSYELFSDSLIGGAGALDGEGWQEIQDRLSFGRIIASGRVDPTEHPHGPQLRLPE